VLQSSSTPAEAGSAAAAGASATVADLPVAPGPLFMLRVVGDMFSFYAVNLTADFMKNFKEYQRKPDKNLFSTRTIVYKLEESFPPSPPAAAPVVESSSGVQAAPVVIVSRIKTTPVSRLHFLNRAHRECIIHTLDRIRQILLEDA
jgi:hypothetical protein